MAKQQNIEMFGEVTQELGNSMFRVRLDNDSIDSEILCTISGKIRQHYIRIMAGDRVKLEISPYDLTRGRIVTRLKNYSKEPDENSESVNKNSSNKQNKKRK